MTEPPTPPPSPSQEQTRTIDADAEARVTIGPYRLLQCVGEGGMGQVWRAEQTATVRRTVALKVLKTGMDTVHVIARFEAERQALAVMDHPAIAKVFDAGRDGGGAAVLRDGVRARRRDHRLLQSPTLIHARAA